MKDNVSYDYKKKKAKPIRRLLNIRISVNDRQLMCYMVINNKAQTMSGCSVSRQPGKNIFQFSCCYFVKIFTRNICQRSHPQSCTTQTRCPAQSMIRLADTVNLNGLSSTLKSNSGKIKNMRVQLKYPTAINKKYGLPVQFDAVLLRTVWTGIFRMFVINYLFREKKNF